MSFWNTIEIKKTRKPHKCAYCGRIIPYGSSCESNSGTYEGDFCYYHICNRCVKFIYVYNCDLEDGFSEGDFYDYINDLSVACPECTSLYHDHEWDNTCMICEYECDDCKHKWNVDYSMGVTDEPKPRTNKRAL
jgi:hypothetical protein